MPEVGDEAVRARTGKNWAQWFAALDKEGAASKTHKEIVAILSDKHGLGPWWRQMVTVAYERARGLREKHETPEGYQLGASKTIAVPLKELYAAWTEARRREKWLPKAKLTVRKSTPSKSMRITWSDGSHVDVLFTAKGNGKSQVAVGHRKLPNRGEVERMKKFWRGRLEALGTMLES